MFVFQDREFTEVVDHKDLQQRHIDTKSQESEELRIRFVFFSLSFQRLRFIKYLFDCVHM